MAEEKMRYISVPSAFAMYKVPEDTFSLLANGMAVTPPLIVLEVMVMNGEAERVGSIAMTAFPPQDDTDDDEDDEDDALPESGSPFGEDTE